MKVYLSGPMSGIPNFNRFAFEEATAALRRAGIEVVSPVELDQKDGLELSDDLMGQYWKLLGRDIQLIGEGRFDAIVLLEGWQRSKGARLEVFEGLMLKLDFYTFYRYDDEVILEAFLKREILDVLASSVRREL